MVVLQDWVTELGLRFQGTLLGAMRGCDLVPKEHISKKLTRAIRCEVLNTPCTGGGPVTATSVKPSSYIEYFADSDLTTIMLEFCSDLDQYPLHYVLHLTHAAEIVGYFLPAVRYGRACCWLTLYNTICKKFHMHPESKEECLARLGAAEREFARAQTT